MYGTDRVSVSQRKHCFLMFWNLASYNSQNAYIAGAVKETALVGNTAKPINASTQENISYMMYLFAGYICEVSWYLNKACKYCTEKETIWML